MVNGWLSPAGDFYACAFGQHCFLAYYLVKKDYDSYLEEEGVFRSIHLDSGIKTLKSPNYSDFLLNYEYVLECRGFWKVSDSRLYGTKQPTQSQLDKVYEMRLPRESVAYLMGAMNEDLI